MPAKGKPCPMAKDDSFGTSESRVLYLENGTKTSTYIYRSFMRIKEEKEVGS